MSSPKKTPTKEDFHEALRKIDNLTLSYHKSGIKIHINDEIIESIRVVKTAISSLLFLDEQDINWASSTISHVKKLNAERAIDFDGKDEEIRGLLSAIGLTIRDQRAGFEKVFCRD
jgi:hypothetical protein